MLNIIFTLSPAIALIVHAFAAYTGTGLLERSMRREVDCNWDWVCRHALFKYGVDVRILFEPCYLARMGPTALYCKSVFIWNGRRSLVRQPNVVYVPRCAFIFIFLLYRR